MNEVKFQRSSLIEIAIAAGLEISQVYASMGEEEQSVEYKSDNSPITNADRRAHVLIDQKLKLLSPDIPCLSEEGDYHEFTERSKWSRYWLIDPLDGTKEFINRNGEFTVNIALIDNGMPIMGVVHVPCSEKTYFGSVEDGAWCFDGLNSAEKIETSQCQNPLRVVASRRHRGQFLENFIKRIEKSIGPVRTKSIGSSLKICLLAEGSADLYPRFMPTSEWDTAAAHAVLAAAGGDIFDLNFKPLRYNTKDSLLNPSFVAVADLNFDWKAAVNFQKQ
ncbi:MAG: 3'(2'),5'-bisphosphate nucleotidase CysQ [Gammaproteobacteria bacterium]|nr:3'(2'),5'-bisphosphate nucleotidase CysQ [Gammaproteobacteria bacterium]